MWKKFPFFPSHSANVAVEVGICELELPVGREEWRAEELSVRATVLCHGAPVHSAPACTRAPVQLDDERSSVVWSETLSFPVKVRELTRDATLAVSVVAENGRSVASSSVALFDARGALKQGLVKIVAHAEEDSRGRKAAARASALGGGRGPFVAELRGDDVYEAEFAAVDYLFQADKLREKLHDRGPTTFASSVQQRSHQFASSSSGTGGQTSPSSQQQQQQRRQSKELPPPQASSSSEGSKPASSSSARNQPAAWLDELSLRRVEACRRSLADREAWARSAHASLTERDMLSRAFLILEMPRFDHPVLFEEKPYPAAPLPIGRTSKALVSNDNHFGKASSSDASVLVSDKKKSGVHQKSASSTKIIASRKRRATAPSSAREEDLVKAATRAATTAFAKPPDRNQQLKRGPGEANDEEPSESHTPDAAAAVVVVENNDNGDSPTSTPQPQQQQEPSLTSSLPRAASFAEVDTTTAVLHHNSREDDFFVVDDYEDGVASNPIEDKYRALARDATRALVDRDLKPNVHEARALARVIASPSDDLAPLDRELVWKFRYTLTGDAQALPKFLLSVD